MHALRNFNNTIVINSSHRLCCVFSTGEKQTMDQSTVALPAHLKKARVNAWNAMDSCKQGAIL